MLSKFMYHAEGRHATWLKLFYDLVFVAIPISGGH